MMMKILPGVAQGAKSAVIKSIFVCICESWKNNFVSTWTNKILCKEVSLSITLNRIVHRSLNTELMSVANARKKNFGIMRECESIVMTVKTLRDVISLWRSWNFLDDENFFCQLCKMWKKILVNVAVNVHHENDWTTRNKVVHCHVTSNDERKNFIKRALVKIFMHVMMMSTIKKFRWAHDEKNL